MFGNHKLVAVLASVFMAGSAMAAGPVAPGDVQIVDGELAQSLTGVEGNAAEGRKIFANRGLGNCLACHAVTSYPEELFHGDVGPSLDGVADRWTPEQLRAIVVNSKAVFSEETVMPGFYSLEVGLNVDEKRAGQTVLDAQQVEDVVAYLMTLKE